jgi:hypothetical protein
VNPALIITCFLRVTFKLHTDLFRVMNLKRTNQTTSELAVAIIGVSISSAAVLVSLGYSTTVIAQKQNTILSGRHVSVFMFS